MLKANDLIAEACSQTGLRDFGDDYFREGLEKFLACVAVEMDLSDAGSAAVRGRTLSYLINRLEIEDWYRRHPEIDAEEIVAPIFGLGLPRTGSTVLQCLLAEDPDARSLRTWESEKPCPPPDARTQSTDPRIAQVAAGIAELYRLAPLIQKMLPLEGPNDPTECQDLMGLSHRSQGFLGAVLPGYLDWLMECDMEPAYRYHKRVLKLLQWRCPPNHWRLKSPVHMLNMTALIKVYPDARFVVTHRDVVHSLPSMAGMLGALAGIFAKSVDLTTYGPIGSHVWKTALDRMMDFRARTGEEKFFDLSFHDIQKDSMDAVRRFYAWAGLSYTPVYEQRMKAWIAAHPKRKHGDYQIVPEEYGLSAPDLRQKFATYLDRYQAFVTPPGG